MSNMEARFLHLPKTCHYCAFSSALSSLSTFTCKNSIEGAGELFTDYIVFPTIPVHV